MGKRLTKKILARTESWLLLILLLLLLVVSFVSPRFFTLRNAMQILRTSAFTGILSIGFLVVLIQGGLDISFTATATVAQYLMALVLASNPNVPIVIVVILPMAIGTALGAFNALLIHSLNAPSIIIAISNLNIYYGVLQIVSGGKWIYDFPEWFNRLGKGFIFNFRDKNGASFGLAYITLIWVVVAIVGAVILKYMKIGRYLYALGGNIEAARRSGLNVFRLRIFSYAFLGLLAGLAGIVQALDTQTVAPNALVGREFNVVAAVVLGGANIFGGAGTVVGTILGVLLITVITNALTIMKIPAYWHQVFIGVVVLGSISITSLRTLLARRKERGINVC